MTREGSKEAAKIMLAHANGKKIEFRWRGSSNWMEMDGNPNWNWEGYQYRIKPQQTSIPATEEEIVLVKGVVFIKDKKTNIIEPTFVYPTNIDSEKYFLLNQVNMVWEDWENK